MHTSSREVFNARPAIFANTATTMATTTEGREKFSETVSTGATCDVQGGWLNDLEEYAHIANKNAEA